MGVAVFATQPPFSIQLMSEMPVVSAGFYDAPKQTRHVIFPQGLIVLPDAFLVTYGRDDRRMRLARFERRKLLEALQPPLPASRERPPC